MLEIWAGLRGKSGSGDNGLSAASERLPEQHWSTLHTRHQEEGEKMQGSGGSDIFRHWIVERE